MVPERHACRGDGDEPLFLTVRRCALPGNACAFTHAGLCAGDPDAADPRPACEGETEAGEYTGCHAWPATDGVFPPEDRRFDAVVTVYVRPTDFTAGLLAVADGGEDCGPEMPSAASPPLPADAPRGLAGLPCRSDETCGLDPLICDTQVFQGICTAPCTPSVDRLEEATACGDPNSTCLQLGEDGVCTAKCAPGGPAGAAGACAPGQMCTNRWLLYADPDPVPGCLPACHADADCPFPLPCQTRLLGCGARVDETLLADGEPCDFREGNVCRGACLVTGDSPEKGICASFIDAVVDAECPDDPGALRPITPGGFGRADDLGVCLYRRCADDTDCTAPLRCRAGVRPSMRVCAWE